MLLILSEFARNEDLHDGFFASKTSGYKPDEILGAISEKKL